jgi:hypothetical protein
MPALLIRSNSVLKCQPRCSGHQVLNRLTTPPRQGLNSSGLNQLLEGLRHRGLLHLPQLHQLGLGLDRSRIHLRPGQQALPGGVAQLLLQFRPVALQQRQQQILQPLSRVKTLGRRPTSLSRNRSGQANGVVLDVPIPDRWPH